MKEKVMSKQLWCYQQFVTASTKIWWYLMQWTWPRSKGDTSFLVKQMGLELPLLPIESGEEIKVFTQLMKNHPNPTDSNFWLAFDESKCWCRPSLLQWKGKEGIFLSVQGIVTQNELLHLNHHSRVECSCHISDGETALQWSQRTLKKSKTSSVWSTILHTTKTNGDITHQCLSHQMKTTLTFFVPLKKPQKMTMNCSIITQRS